MDKLKDLGRSASLANLLLINEWLQLVYPFRSHYFDHPLRLIGFVSLVVACLLGTSVFYALFRCAHVFRNERPRVFTGCYLALIGAFLLALNEIKSASGLSVSFPSLFSFSHFLYDWGPSGNRIKAALLAIVFFAIYLRFERYAVFFFRRSLAILLPAVFVTFGHVGWNTESPRSAISEIGRVSNAPAAPRRVLWLLFDEMDEYYSTSGKPPGVALPEIDQLKHESFAATNAYPPSNATLQSIPAYTSGKMVSNAETAHFDLRLSHCGESDTVAWGRESSVFSKAKAMGLKTAIAGWYHPYCAIFDGTVDDCTSFPFSRHKFNNSIFKNISYIFRSAFGMQGGSDAVHDNVYRGVLKHANRLATNQNLGLVFVHWPIPHHPAVTDPASSGFSYPKNEAVESHFKNLILTDHALGELRRSMIAAKQWDNTTVIVTSDHWWRFVPRGGISGKETRHYQVPFIVKLAGQSQGAVYTKAFNTILLRELILSILKGEVKTAEETAQWVSAHGSRTAPQFARESSGTSSAPNITCASHVEDLPTAW